MQHLPALCPVLEETVMGAPLETMALGDPVGLPELQRCPQRHTECRELCEHYLPYLQALILRLREPKHLSVPTASKSLHGAKQLS